MAKLFPELFFTRGPQKGQRAILSKTMNVIGRDKTCDVEVQDEYASRQHARIIVEGSRVRLVNVSPNGTKVNGQLADQVTLDHGNLIGLGLECEARIELAEEKEAPAPSGGAAAATPAQKPAAATRAADTAQLETQPKKKFKKPTMIVWVMIYLAGLAGVFMLLRLLTGGDGPSLVSRARCLTDDEIREIIARPLPPEQQDERLANAAIDRAVRGFDAFKTGGPGSENLYVTLREFKAALGYLHAKGFGARLDKLSTGEKIMTQVMKDNIEEALSNAVRTNYKNAYICQRQGRWRDAQRLYQVVLGMIPEQQDDIWKNVTEQLNLVNGTAEKQKNRRTAGW